MSSRMVRTPLILSLSPFDVAQGDPEALEGSKDERAYSARRPLVMASMK